MRLGNDYDTPVHTRKNAALEVECGAIGPAL